MAWKGTPELENGDFVGLANCFICGKPKYLVLDKRLKKSLPKSAVYEKEPCEECLKVMEQGIYFIGVRDGETGDNPYRTGHLIGISEEAFKKIALNKDLKQQILKKRVCFIEESTLKKMGLITKTGKLKYKKKLK